MRFIRKELSISTVCDKEINDDIEMMEVLNNLNSYNVEFSFEYKKYFQSDYDHINFHYNKVRIDKIYESDNKIDIIILDNNTKVRLKGIKFEDIVFISAITKKSDLLKVYKDLNRFDFMDLTD